MNYKPNEHIPLRELAAMDTTLRFQFVDGFNTHFNPDTGELTVLAPPAMGNTYGFQLIPRRLSKYMIDWTVRKYTNYVRSLEQGRCVFIPF